jgi:hypothetical protein
MAAEVDGEERWHGGVEIGQLVELGKILDRRPASLEGKSVAIALAAMLLKVRSRDGFTAPLIANEAQRRFEQRRGQRNIVLKARQMGLTTWTAGRFFLKTVTRPGTLTLQVAHTQEAAEEIFRIVHRFLDWLPEELREGPLRTSRANVRQIVFPELDSQYRVVTAGDRNAGRGLTVQNLHCSELARWPGDPGEILAGLRAGMAPDGEVILESTPQGVGGCFYEEWQKAHETGTVRHFFPWWMEPRYRAAAADAASLTEEERELIERARLDLCQLGFRRQIRAGFRGLAAQEYAEDAESCFLASGESVFDLEMVDARLKDLAPPYETRRNGTLEMYMSPVPGREYIVGVDPAGGGANGDYSAAQVVDVEQGMQCAEFAAHVRPRELARIAVELAREYNNAWLVVERNNHGSAVLGSVEESLKYEKVYGQKGQAGWLTTSVSKPQAVERLERAVAEHPWVFSSKRLLGEFRSFVRMPDGGAGAKAGTHDDRVMAMAIALAARADLLQGGARRQ